MLILLVSLVLVAVSAALYCTGMLPPAWMKATAFVITAAAVITGTIYCGKRLPRWKLPGCILSTTVYLLCVYLLKQTVFGPASARSVGIVICAASAALVGAVISGMEKHR